jgi:membrane-associated phospholipid phosphatase
LVATSRIYLGVHWLTDVVASIAYSTAWILITMIVIQQ